MYIMRICVGKHMYPELLALCNFNYTLCSCGSGGQGRWWENEECGHCLLSQKNVEKKSCLCPYRGNRGQTPYCQSAIQLFITTQTNKTRDTKTDCHQSGEHIELRWSVRLGRGCGGYHTSPESCMASEKCIQSIQQGLQGDQISQS